MDSPLGILMLEGKMADVPGCMACEATFPYPVVRKTVRGVPDTYCEELAPHEAMLRTYGLDSAGIARAARRALDLREARR